MSWADAAATVVRLIAVPYGYTLAIWSAGMLAASRYGRPRGREVLLFVGGAILGYLLFDLISLRAATDTLNGAQKALPKLALFNVLPLLPPVAVGVLAREIRNRFLGFFTIGFGATVVYVASVIALARLAS